MPQPRHAAAEFGEELRGLRREDGARLISRLYYAIFHCVCLQLQLDLKGAHVHEQLLDALRRRDANSIRAANRLNSLRQLRILADYNRDESLSQMQLQSAMHHAGAVRSLLGITGPTNGR